MNLDDVTLTCAIKALGIDFAIAALGVPPGEESFFCPFFPPLLFGFLGGVLGDCERSSSSLFGFSGFAFAAGVALGGSR